MIDYSDEEKKNLIIKINELFSEYEKTNKYLIDDLIVDDFIINEYNATYFSIDIQFRSFYVINSKYNKQNSFFSENYETLEELLDEIIIFKEFILPKYL